METFWNTIAQYNESTWWAQILITAAGILLTALLYRRPTVWTKRSMKIYMVFLNGWIALVYYAMYCDTRNYHYVLSAFWGTVALIWLWDLFTGYTPFVTPSTLCWQECSTRCPSYTRSFRGRAAWSSR